MSEHRPDLEEAAEIVARMGDATLLRSVASVIVGFIVVTLGSVIAGRALVSLFGVVPGEPMAGGFVVASLLSRFAVAALAGLLTARAAPHRPFLHAGILAGLLAFLALVALAGLRAAGAEGLEGPPWYPGAMTLVGPAGALLGGWLGTLRRVRRATA